MRWSSAAARGLQHPTTVMITNNNDDVREANKSTGPAKAAVSVPEVFVGIDAADARQVVTRFIPSEGPKPAEGMSKDTLVKRVAQLLKAGFRVRCVYELGWGQVLSLSVVRGGLSELKGLKPDPVRPSLRLPPAAFFNQ